MKTNELIDRLGTDLAPVERLPRPGSRAARWLGVSFAYVAAMASVATLLVSSNGEVDWSFIGSQVLGVVAGCLAALAAFASVVPGYSRSAMVAAIVATVAWLVSFVMLAAGSGATQPVAAPQDEWICVAMILLGGAPLVAALAVMLRKGAPINPMLSGLLAALAVGLLANFSACLSSPHGNVGTALVWHVGTLAVLVSVCVIGSRFVLRWRPAG